MSHLPAFLLIWAKQTSNMVTTLLQYPMDKNVGGIAQFALEHAVEAAERLVRLGICPPAQAKEVTASAMECLKTAYYNKNMPDTPALWNAFLTFAVQETQSMGKKLEQNFGLSELEFERMAAALRAGDKSMFEFVFLAHFAACRRYVCKTYGASLEDAYDATMDTLMEFHHRLAEGKIQYGNLRYLFTKMAGQRYQRSQRAWSEAQSIPADALASENTLAHEADSILEKAWDKLCEECRRVLKDFYYDKKNLNVLAEEMGKDHSAMRKQKQRCVDKLRVYFMRFL